MKEEVLNTEFVGKHFIQMSLTLKCAMSYKLFSKGLIELCFKSRKQQLIAHISNSDIIELLDPSIIAGCTKSLKRSRPWHSQEAVAIFRWLYCHQVELILEPGTQLSHSSNDRALDARHV